MSNSSLAKLKKISPNSTNPRNHAIDTITIHHCAGVLSAEQIGNIFASKDRNASCNYGIGNDGTIILVVDEGNRSWCSSNRDNDHRAITIEVSNDVNGEPWSVSSKAYTALIKLVTDICKRNGITQLIWSNDKTRRVAHVNGANMTIHRDFAATACPGTYLMGKMPDIANRVNKGLKAPVLPNLPSRGYFDIGDGYETNTNMKSQIKLIQNFLKKVIKSKIDDDGKYGEQTSDAVKVWQGLRQKGRADMIVDGLWGKQCNEEMAKTYGIY